MKKVALIFLTLALGMACAKQYAVTLFVPSVVSGTELKAGDYMLDLQSGKIVIKNGRVRAESAVKVETAPAKYPSTAVRYAAVDGKSQVREIRLGGTNLKLVID
jgi:hypothetical protein